MQVQPDAHDYKVFYLFCNKRGEFAEAVDDGWDSSVLKSTYLRHYCIQFKLFKIGFLIVCSRII